MGHARNFDEFIIGFIGETLRGKVSRENFDESLAIRQSFLPSNFCTIQLLAMCVVSVLSYSSYALSYYALEV